MVIFYEAAFWLFISLGIVTIFSLFRAVMLRNIYFFAVSRGICYKFCNFSVLDSYNSQTIYNRLGRWGLEDCVSLNIPGYVCRVHLSVTDAPRSYSAHYFFLTITLSRCQISSTYSSIVLSDVNLPLHAVLRSAFLAHPFSSL